MPSVRGSVAPGASVRLTRADGSAGSIDAKPNSFGTFTFPDVSSGWYILSAWMPGYSQTVTAVRVEGAFVDAGPIPSPAPVFAWQGPANVPVLAVCEALDIRESLASRVVVVVGIFKSGMDETLRLDCPTQLRTGEIGWPSAIGLTKVGNVPDELRGEVEKKRQGILASAPPEAPLRPERVIGLYGVFNSLTALGVTPCCGAAIETVLPPARLFGIGETDLRVIR